MGTPEKLDRFIAGLVIMLGLMTSIGLTFIGLSLFIGAMYALLAGG